MDGGHKMFRVLLDIFFYVRAAVMVGTLTGMKDMYGRPVLSLRACAVLVLLDGGWVGGGTLDVTAHSYCGLMGRMVMRHM